MKLLKIQNKELLNKYEDDLCNIFITSQAILTDSMPEGTLREYTEDDYTVFVTKAMGEKCERCWKYRQLGVVSGHETICQECHDAINK